MPASEFSKDRCKVVHLCWGNPKHKHRLDGEHTESRPGDLRVLVDKKLSVTEQRGLAAQKPQPYPGLHQKKQEQQVEVLCLLLHFCAPSLEVLETTLGGVLSNLVLWKVLLPLARSLGLDYV